MPKGKDLFLTGAKGYDIVVSPELPMQQPVSAAEDGKRIARHGLRSLRLRGKPFIENVLIETIGPVPTTNGFDTTHCLVAQDWNLIFVSQEYYDRLRDPGNT